MKRTLYLASKNTGKIMEYKNLLADVNCNLLLQPDFIEVVEDGLSFQENAFKKASEVSRRTNAFAIADDSGLCIDALDGAPGIYSSRFAANDQARINRVLIELEGNINRNAFFLANICLCSPSGELLLNSEGKCPGNILLESRGNNGFGYDPIFEEKISKLTFAEMSDLDKQFFSHRGIALRKIIPELQKIFD